MFTYCLVWFSHCVQVTIEKFLSPEQRKKMEEEAKAEEEQRMREKGDNWRDRGLDQMMGGVLEVKKEDELKKVESSGLFNKIWTIWVLYN